MNQAFIVSESVKKQHDLTGRTCVITGGGGFLGRQFAAAIAEMGGVPVLLDIAEADTTTAAEEVASAWGPCEVEIADVRDEFSLAKAVERVLARHGRIDVLINSAALTKHGCSVDPDSFFAPFEAGSTAAWNAGLATNLTGLMLACKLVGAAMVRQKKGSIINVGSEVGVVSPDQRIYAPDPTVGYPGVSFNTPAFYAVSKAGVIHFTKYLATLWAPHGIRVNCFSPAGVYRDHEPGFVTKLSDRIPLGRMAVANEYKGAIVFLASDASSFMTGHNLVMDGGRTVW